MLLSKMSAVIIIVISVALGERLKAHRQPLVTTNLGTVQGKILESAIHRRKYAAFQGIPYAKPPVGSLRFQEPEPADSWPGVLRADMDAPICMQWDNNRPDISVRGSEDCLYLNVYTPRMAKKLTLQFIFMVAGMKLFQNESNGDREHLLNVIFYIHGGGFAKMSGTGSRAERVLDRDVVLVTFNYRLGPLGFLSLQNSVIPGNNGLKDQLLALKWVKNNIAHFGGDPYKISLAGMSAGAASVHYHVLSPLSKGLFISAILESGAALSPWALVENSKDHALDLARRLRCPTDSTQLMVDCLKGLPGKRIIATAEEIKMSNISAHIPFAPVVEPVSYSAIIPKHPRELLSNKETQDLPMLFSFTTDEGLLMAQKWILTTGQTEKLEKEWEAISPLLLDFNHTVDSERLTKVAKAIREHYLGNGSLLGNTRKLIKMVSDRHFFSPIALSAKLGASAIKSPVYAFQFGYKSTRRYTDNSLPREVYDGVGHVAHSLLVVPQDDFIFQVHSTDEAMAEALLDLWITFIANRTLPCGWKTVQEGLPNFNFMRIDSAAGIENKMESREDFGDSKFWDSIHVE